MSFYEAHKQTCRSRRDSGNCLLAEENSLLRERIAVLEKESEKMRTAIEDALSFPEVDLKMCPWDELDAALGVES
jgi:hypothetical protein